MAEMTGPSPERLPQQEDYDPHAVVRFCFELSQLRQEARHGWLRIHENPESVAEHSQRAAALGYLLAAQEGFEHPHLVVTMIVFHDMHETRTGDVDRVQRKYLSIDDDAAAESQMEGLGMAGRTILGMWKEVETGSSVAGIIAKDAEILEMALTARELVVRGNPDAQLWIDGIQPRLRTESAREFLSIINTADPSEWWKRICK